MRDASKLTAKRRMMIVRRLETVASKLHELMMTAHELGIDIEVHEGDVTRFYGEAVRLRSLTKSD